MFNFSIFFVSHVLVQNGHGLTFYNSFLVIISFRNLFLVKLNEEPVRVKALLLSALMGLHMATLYLAARSLS